MFYWGCKTRTEHSRAARAADYGARRADDGQALAPAQAERPRGHGRVFLQAHLHTPAAPNFTPMCADRNNAPSLPHMHAALCGNHAINRLLQPADPTNGLPPIHLGPCLKT